MSANAGGNFGNQPQENGASWTLYCPDHLTITVPTSTKTNNTTYMMLLMFRAVFREL
jgi:hypothetical protein